MTLLGKHKASSSHWRTKGVGKKRWRCKKHNGRDDAETWKVIARTRGAPRYGSRCICGGIFVGEAHRKPRSTNKQMQTTSRTQSFVMSNEAVADTPNSVVEETLQQDVDDNEDIDNEPVGADASGTGKHPFVYSRTGSVCPHCRQEKQRKRRRRRDPKRRSQSNQIHLV
jgi:hypothetical protein